MLVLLLVIALIAASMLRVAVTYRDRTRSQERAMQSELLADAGVDRAYARLAEDPSYRGERWDIPAEALGLAATGPGAGPAAVVRIRVESDSPGGASRMLRVQADYPPDEPRRVRSSREIALSDTP